MVTEFNRKVVDAAYGSWFVEGAPLEVLRRGYDDMAPPLPAGVVRTADVIAGVPCAWFRPPGGGSGAIVFYHGGGFVLGSARSHGELCAQLALASSAAVVVPDYRLAPEHRYPAAHDDAVAVYRTVRASEAGSNGVAIAGDSAGGTLTLATAARLRDAGDMLPSCLATMSAWTDLTHSGDTFRNNVNLDPVISQQGARGMAAMYADDTQLSLPDVSPLFGTLQGLPPMLMQVGSHELLLDDTRRFVARARERGVTVESRIYEAQVHVFQLLTTSVPAALEAIREMGTFIRSHLDRANATA